MKSLDQIDFESFAPCPSPVEGDAKVIELAPGSTDHPLGPRSLSLDGEWIMAAGGSERDRLAGDWQDALPARVPGSIQTALLEAGAIPDPYVGKNDEIARAESRKTWWLMRKFQRPLRYIAGMKSWCLAAFAMPAQSGSMALSSASTKACSRRSSLDIAEQLVAGENTLIVKLEPAPQRISTGEPNDFFVGMNVGWLDSAVINNIYGWHYINLPTTRHLAIRTTEWSARSSHRRSLRRNCERGERRHPSSPQS